MQHSPWLCGALERTLQMMATLGCITVTVLTIVIISIVKNAGG